MSRSYNKETASMKYVLCFVTLFFIGCATTQEQKVDDSKPTIDVAFEPYLNKFVEDSRGLVDHEDYENMSMQFADLSGSTVGTCTPIVINSDLSLTKVIKIDRGWWNYVKDEKRREELVYHELGHCILYRDHVLPTYSDNLIGWLERLSFKLGVLRKFDLLPDGCASSYMNPVLVEKSCLYKHYDYYLDELFGLTTVEEYKEVQTKTTTEYEN